MTRPTRFGRVPIMSGSLGSTPVVEPDPDPSEPTDYASQEEGAAIQVAVGLSESSELLEGETIIAGGSPAVPILSLIHI